MASRSWNRVELIGNLTRDPELRYTPNGAAVCTFGVATNRTYVTEGERKEEVDFHRLVAWNKLAELCNQLLKKGNRVFISGRLQTRSWETQDGQTRTVTEIVVEDMILLSPKLSGGENMSAPEDLNIGSKEEKASKTPGADEVSKVFENSEEPKAKETEPEKTAEKAPQEEVKDDLPF
ncbi:single-stranded DNA-binding protein [Candidatus Daviesbacteria bacterium]|nr:single-stranded DNA-binding protein [Candidatus Daviesbacteria bacterium]